MRGTERELAGRSGEKKEGTEKEATNHPLRPLVNGLDESKLQGDGEIVVRDLPPILHTTDLLCNVEDDGFSLIEEKKKVISEENRR